MTSNVYDLSDIVCIYGGYAHQSFGTKRKMSLYQIYFLTQEPYTKMSILLFGINVYVCVCVSGYGKAKKNQQIYFFLKYLY